MANKLYLECNSGISGDMMAAALLDLGADRRVLQSVLDSIPVQGYSVEISSVQKSGINCCDFCVRLDAQHENHDHDMAYLHGHALGPQHTHTAHGTSAAAHNVHTDSTQQQQNGHAHAHRNFAEIQKLLDNGVMTERARMTAHKIFRILAEAEAQVHGVPVEEVHFHEVGAVDSIVDIVSVAVCLDNLDITEVIIPQLCEGTGTVRCQHGILPVPVPAAANIMQNYHLNVHFMNVQGEFVTPTGAAIAAAVKTAETLPVQCKIKKIGVGAGKRNYERPSILRAMLLEDTAQQEDIIVKLESNIDDSTGEALGFVMEQLFAAGARDVHYVPVYMKKNRPGWQLNVICDKQDIAKLEQIIFRETTTIGIRRVEMARSILKREQKTMMTAYGEAQVKVCYLGDKPQFYPEYESVAQLSRMHDVPYMEVYQAVLQQCSENDEKF